MGWTPAMPRLKIKLPLPLLPSGQSLDSVFPFPKLGSQCVWGGDFRRLPTQDQEPVTGCFRRQYIHPDPASLLTFMFWAHILTSHSKWGPDLGASTLERRSQPLNPPSNHPDLVGSPRASPSGQYPVLTCSAQGHL